MASHRETINDETASIIVASLYRALIGRDPDEAGLIVHKEQLSSGLLSETLPNLIRAFLNGPETTGERYGIVQKTVLKQLVKEHAFRFRGCGTFSFGTHCYTSWILQQCELKRFSGPFDWLFSSMGMITHCLQDDFAVFLNPRFYRQVPLEKRVAPWANKCNHSFYQENYGVDHVFNHRDPTQDGDYGYVKRCVNRFRDSVQGHDPTIVFCITRDELHAVEQFQALASELQRYARSSFLVGALIGAPSSAPCATIRWQSLCATLIGFTPTSAWHDLRFSSIVDDICLANALFKSIDAFDISNEA